MIAYCIIYRPYFCRPDNGGWAPIAFCFISVENYSNPKMLGQLVHLLYFFLNLTAFQIFNIWVCTGRHFNLYLF